MQILKKKPKKPTHLNLGYVDYEDVHGLYTFNVR